MNKKTKNTLEQIGRNISELRIKKKFSIDDLSIKSGIRRQYIIKIESGTAFRLSLSHLEKISEGLGTDLFKILKNL